MTEVTIGETLQRIAEVAVGAMDRAEVAGITMLDGNGRPTTGIFTGKTAPALDDAQYESGRGPCLEAFLTRQTVRVDSMADSALLYPELASAAAEHHVKSSLSLPLVTGELALGALNLYSFSEDGFSADDESVGTELASTASVVLSNVSAYWSAYELGQQLAEAMRSRAVIEQAKGMLMAGSPKLTPDDAFDLLRKASQRENVKLRDIALRIVERKSSGVGED